MDGNPRPSVAVSKTTQGNLDRDAADQYPSLSQLENEKNLKVLEAGLHIGSGILHRLKTLLQNVAVGNRGADWSWLMREVDNNLEKTKPARTLIAVCGITGAGKSSLINALLDEESLLPTSCFQACTAAPVEISYNNSEHLDQEYRAEVEFISESEWRRELQALSGDFEDDISTRTGDSTIETDVALAKLLAVYAGQTKNTLATADIDNLMADPVVEGVLGTTKQFSAESAKQLSRQLQPYVDSPEKSDNPKMAYWPLIRVVRIFTKAEVLSTGAVLVDLPGVQDSNSARGAVAKSYLKSCTKLWIVTRIARALDEKTAQDLLGESFRMQQYLDGKPGHITFICTQTDDINVSEFPEEVKGQAWQTAEKLRENLQASQREKKMLTDERRKTDSQLNACKDRLIFWQPLRQEVSNGRQVYAPKENAQGSTTSSYPSSSGESEKATEMEGDLEIDENDITKEVPLSTESDAGEPKGEPLTIEEVEARLSGLNSEMETFRVKGKALTTRLMQLEKQIKGMRTEEASLLGEIHAGCQQHRTEYCTKAIRRGFVSGMKGYAEATSMEAGGDDLDLDDDFDIYEAEGQSLPVFCVSSKAYQKHEGRLANSGLSCLGYRNVEDTQIPQLQAHITQLTEPIRRDFYHGFLRGLATLVNSIKIWTSSSGSGGFVDAGERGSCESDLQQLLMGLHNDIRQLLANTMENFRHVLKDILDTAMADGCRLAIEQAAEIANCWVVRSDDTSRKPMRYRTYAATCRRDGVFTGATGFRNLNEELAMPMVRKIAPHWHTVFNNRVPEIWSSLSADVQHASKAFYNEAMAAIVNQEGSKKRLHILSQQFERHREALQGVPNAARVQIAELQRDANRNFTPVIEANMKNAYRTTLDVGGGKKVFKRMNKNMVDYVTQARTTMFKEAVDGVRGEVMELCATVEKSTRAQFDLIWDEIARDYRIALLGSNPDIEANLRCDVAALLSDADALFAEAFLEGSIQGSDELGEMEVVSVTSSDTSSDTLQDGDVEMLG